MALLALLVKKDGNIINISMQTTKVNVILALAMVAMIIVFVLLSPHAHAQKEGFDDATTVSLDDKSIPDFVLNLDGKVNKLRLDVRMQGDKLDTVYGWYQQQLGQQQAGASAVSAGVQSQLQAVQSDPESAASSLDVHGMLSQLQQSAAVTTPGAGTADQLTNDMSGLNVPSDADEPVNADNEGFYGGRILFWS
jgi:hypothetical protein